MLLSYHTIYEKSKKLRKKYPHFTRYAQNEDKKDRYRRSICIARATLDVVDKNHPLVGEEIIHDTIAADAPAPFIFFAGEFNDISMERICLHFPDGAFDMFSFFGGQPSELFFGVLSQVNLPTHVSIWSMLCIHLFGFLFRPCGSHEVLRESA